MFLYNSELLSLYFFFRFLCQNMIQQIREKDRDSKRNDIYYQLYIYICIYYRISSIIYSNIRIMNYKIVGINVLIVKFPFVLKKNIYSISYYFLLKCLLCYKYIIFKLRRFSNSCLCLYYQYVLRLRHGKVHRKECFNLFAAVCNRV